MNSIWLPAVALLMALLGCQNLNKLGSKKSISDQQPKTINEQQSLSLDGYLGDMGDMGVFEGEALLCAHKNEKGEVHYESAGSRDPSAKDTPSSEENAAAALALMHQEPHNSQGQQTPASSSTTDTSIDPECRKRPVRRLSLCEIANEWTVFEYSKDSSESSEAKSLCVNLMCIYFRNSSQQVASNREFDAVKCDKKLERKQGGWACHIVGDGHLPAVEPIETSPGEVPMPPESSGTKDAKDLIATIESLTADKSCNTNGHCKVVGLAKKACGGYSSFLMYSAPMTNEAELKPLLDKYHALSDAANKDIASDCMMAAPPQATCSSEKICVLKP